MSPRNFVKPAPEAVVTRVEGVWAGIGQAIRAARMAKKWTLVDLARRAGVSRTVAYIVEAGRATSLEAVVRLTNALGLRLDFELTDPRRKDSRPGLSADPVHSAMGELEARHLRGLQFPVGIDEPYQHYQFAGRADIVAWDVARAALLHIENRTRFPDFQDTAASYNAKRAYLAEAIGQRTGVTRWSSQTHAMAALWSSEVLHALRMRRESFRSLCPDPADAIAAWWRGEPPQSGNTSTLIALDPLATGRQRLFVGLDDAMTIRPRHLGYAQAAAALMAHGV